MKKKIQQTESNYLYLLQRYNDLKFYMHGQNLKAAVKTCLINIHEVFDDVIAKH